MTETWTEDVASIAAVAPEGSDPGTRAMRARLARSMFGAAVTPTMIGRYRVLRRLGAGGMGVVYEASDDELDRRVAIKVMHHGISDDQSARLQQEARALARLSHPNVVHVYEVGHSHTRPFLVMELVRGQTLAVWQRGRERREILRAYIEAGRALAAAHDAGIVHRDFKPANAIVGTDGRVRVLDFGLAASFTPESHSGQSTADGESATTRGGTPAYMSPEQLRRGRVGPASDQFSFCVALHEAWFGSRPFSGDTPEGYAEAVARGIPSRPPGRGQRWIRRVLEKGLRVDPSARHPSMHELTRRLARGPRSGAFVIGGGVVGVLLAAALFARPDETCPEGLAAQLQARRASVQEPRLAAALDEYARRWEDAVDRACAAAPGMGPGRRVTREDELACLAAAQIEALALVDGLDDAPTRQPLPRSAVEAVRTVASCADGSVPAAWLEPGVLRRGVRLRLGLLRARQQREHGRLAEAEAGLRALEEQRDDDPALEPIFAEILVERGRVVERSGDPRAALVVLERARKTAIASGNDRAAADAWLEIADIECVDLRRPERAREVFEQAAAFFGRLDPDPRRDAVMRRVEGLVAAVEGDHERALEILLDARVRTAAAYGEDHPELARVLVDLANELSELGRAGEALEMLAAVLEIRSRHFGADHPLLAPVHHNRGVMLLERGDVALAREAFGRALELAGETDALQRARTRVGLAAAMAATGDLSPALEHASAAEATLRDLSGHAHPERVIALSLVANVQDAMEDHDAALSSYRALRALHEGLGATIEGAKVQNNIVAKLVDLERFDEARTELERCLPSLESRLGAEHPWLAPLLLSSALVHLAEGEHQPARQELERAHRLVADATDPALVAVREEVAQALSTDSPGQGSG